MARQLTLAQLRCINKAKNMVLVIKLDKTTGKKSANTPGVLPATIEKCEALGYLAVSQQQDDSLSSFTAYQLEKKYEEV